MFGIVLFNGSDTSYHGVFTSYDKASKWLTSGGADDIEYLIAEIFEMKGV